MAVAGAIFTGNDWQLGAKISAGLFVAWLLFLGIRKAIIHYQAKKKVEALIEVEEPEKKRFALPKREPKSELEQNFKGMVKLLRGSYLKNHGEPEYVLPWYLVLGNEDSQPHGVIKQAALPRPTIEDKGLSKTAQAINWHLYNQGILIDTPASYISGSGSQNNEWIKLLGMLKKYREREPINGLVVSVSMSELLADNNQALIEHGTNVRKNIEQLMQVMHIEVPVYVVVTGSDALSGFSELVNSLEDEQLEQAMGQSNQDREAVEPFIKRTMAEMSERLKQLTLNALANTKADPDLLLLANQFESLERPLRLFTDSVFQSNPYQKTPFFRGLYFVAQQDEQTVFARQLLTEILPSERHLLESLTRSERAEQGKQFGKAAVWNIAAAVVLVSLYGAYQNKASILDEALTLYAGNFEKSTDFSQNIETMYEYRTMVQMLNGYSWTPWLANAGTPEFITKLEGIFSERVQMRLVDEADRAFSKELATAFDRDADISEEKIVAFISTLVRRINILDAYMAGESFDSISAMPMPYNASDADFFDIKDESSIDRLNTLYVQSLMWTKDKGLLEQELGLMNKQLNDILINSRDFAKWLIPWANAVAKDSETRISDFWQAGTGAMTGDVVVKGAFTLAGKAQIDGFIEQIRATKRYDAILNDIEPEFRRQYQRQYLQSWEQFSQNFMAGSTKLRGREEWLTVLNNLSTGRNIYFNALNTLDEQLKPFYDAENVPDWVNMVGYYQEMRAFGPEEKTDNGKQGKVLAKMGMQLAAKAGPVGKALAGAGKSGMKTQKKLDKAKGKGGPNVDERAMQLEAAGKLLGDYRMAMENFVYSAEMRSVSHAAVSGVFASPDNPGAGESTLAAGYTSIKKLQAIVGKENKDNRAFWQLYTGALMLMQDYMVEESACELQDIWSRDFLAQLEGVPEYKLSGLAFGSEGKLWGFMDTNTAPFVGERLGAGYVAKSLGDIRYPVSGDFLTFASRAKDAKQAKQDVYKVSVATKPTSVNLDAKYHVSKTALTMQCAEGNTELVNMNFPSNSLFEWNENCADVVLKLEVGRINLEKRYEGALGFPEFLNDFKTGTKRFTAADFPKQAEQLRQSGVSFMEVKYSFDGHQSLLDSLENKKLDIPSEITQCWVSNTLELAQAD